MEMKLTLPPVIQNPALLSQPTPGALNTGYSTKGSCIIPLSPTPMDSLQQQRLLFIRQFSERLEISKDHQLYEINPQEVVNKLLIENIIENTSSRRNSHRYTADGSDTTSTVSNQQQQSWTPPNRHMKAFTFTTSTPQQQKMMMNPPPGRKSNRSNNSSSAGAAASHNLLKESIMNMNAGHTPRPPGQNVSSSQSKHFFPSNPAPQSVQYDYHKYSNRPLPQPSNDPRQHSPAVISTLQALNPFAKKSNTPRSNQDDEREEERHPNDYEDGDRDHDDTASQISFVREQLLADDNTELRKLPSEFHPHHHHHSYHHPVPHHHQPEQHQSEKRQLKRTLSNHQEGSLSPKQRTEDIYLKDNCLPIDDYPADYEELEEYKARNTNNEEEYDSDYWEDERLMLKWEARRMGLIYFGMEELQKHTQQMKLSEEERMKLLMK